ncbi:MAG: hypothetical protein HGB12_15025, partial [Bacteroidetes bacterium]|nr:hypothetical protein [Bacteroidota bacterium]
DPSGSLLIFYEWFKTFNDNDKIKIFFLYGEACNYIETINKIPKLSNISFVPFSENIIKEADIALCAFGVTLYELVYLNIQTISFGHTLMHAQASKRFCERYKCTIDLGLLADIDKDMFYENLDSLINNFQKRKLLFENSLNLVDGKGVERFVKILENVC